MSKKQDVKKLSLRTLDVIHGILFDASYRVATRKARVILTQWAEPYMEEVRARVMSMELYDPYP